MAAIGSDASRLSASVKTCAIVTRQTSAQPKSAGNREQARVINSPPAQKKAKKGAASTFAIGDIKESCEKIAAA